MRMLLITLVIFFISCNDSANTNTVYVHDTIYIYKTDSTSITTVSKKKTKKKKENSQNLNPVVSNYISKPKPVANTQAYSSQCMAITKKGYRCLRRARSNSYCWQHGG